MTGQLALALGGLALVDATSVGTLVLPLLMLVQPRVRAGRVLLYLATIAVFYFALGLALLVALDRLVALVAAIEGNRAIDVVQLVVGVGLLAGSFWPDLPAVKRKREAGPAVGGRRASWRERLLGPSARPGAPRSCWDRARYTWRTRSRSACPRRRLPRPWGSTGEW